jgi:hypothetical protein
VPIMPSLMGGLSCAKAEPNNASIESKKIVFFMGFLTTKRQIG